MTLLHCGEVTSLHGRRKSAREHYGERGTPPAHLARQGDDSRGAIPRGGANGEQHNREGSDNGNHHAYPRHCLFQP